MREWPFVWIDVAVIDRMKEIGAVGFAVYVYIARHGNSPTVCSMQQVARALDMPVSLVRARIEILIQKGLLLKHDGEIYVLGAR